MLNAENTATYNFIITVTITNHLKGSDGSRGEDGGDGRDGEDGEEGRSLDTEGYPCRRQNKPSSAWSLRRCDDKIGTIFNNTIDNRPNQ